MGRLDLSELTGPQAGRSKAELVQELLLESSVAPSLHICGALACVPVFCSKVKTPILFCSSVLKLCMGIWLAGAYHVMHPVTCFKDLIAIAVPR